MKRFLVRLPKAVAGKQPIPAGRVYKRRLVPVKQRPELLQFLAAKLAEPGFFNGLGDLWFGRVKKFSFKGTPVVIKDTRGDIWHGSDFNGIRANMFDYHKALRNGAIKAQHYILKSPKVYGKIGNYLAMEYIEQVKFPDRALQENALNAFREMKDNFRELESKCGLGWFPQLNSSIVVGNTNPKNPEKGKWIFFFPYDYI